MYTSVPYKLCSVPICSMTSLVFYCLAEIQSSREKFNFSIKTECTVGRSPMMVRCAKGSQFFKLPFMGMVLGIVLGCYFITVLEAPIYGHDSRYSTRMFIYRD